VLLVWFKLDELRAPEIPVFQAKVQWGSDDEHHIGVTQRFVPAMTEDGGVARWE
jgi:hypothetical protein